MTYDFPPFVLALPIRPFGLVLMGTTLLTGEWHPGSAGFFVLAGFRCDLDDRHVQS